VATSRGRVGDSECSFGWIANTQAKAVAARLNIVRFRGQDMQGLGRAACLPHLEIRAEK
jgi:hypothetical protein